MLTEALRCQPIAPEFNPAAHPIPVLQGAPGMWRGRFKAMASDCEILMEGMDAEVAAHLLRRAAIEAWRIEYKFSRYVTDNLIARINRAARQPVKVDDETADLFDFATQCFELSGGLFDISSGVLRRIWRFDGGSHVPSASAISSTLALIGWHKVAWDRPYLTLLPGMEIDLGGIGKEYAVDKVVQVLRDHRPAWTTTSFLVNFGGDLACTGPRLDGSAWCVGVESSEHNHAAVAQARLATGALATSGDSRRFVRWQGKRLGHILNPLTGWPVENAPHAISVAAPSCLHAGMLSTLAMLQGEQAEAFLAAQGLQFWVQR